MEKIKTIFTNAIDTNKLKKAVTNIVTFTLLIALILEFALSTMKSVKADSLLGTNAALGSPLLNSSAVADDWNKYEAIVWGIFLGNFCIPFVDDYESAFNLNSTVGSKGRGLKALCFAGGSDPSNNETIQDLVTYAINMQKQSPKKISVSFNVREDDNWTTVNAFGTLDSQVSGVVRSSSSSSDTSDSDDSSEYIETTSSNSASAGSVRDATLKDLFLMYARSDEEISENKSYLKQTSNRHALGVFYNTTTFLLELTGNYNEDNVADKIVYPYIAYERNYSIPTFAVTKGTSGSGAWEVILDYTDPFDFEMAVGSMTYALNSEYRSDAINTIFGNASSEEISNLPLYSDSFGNICVRTSDNKYIVVVPSAANQHMTKEPSLNLINSLIFNSGTSSNDKSNILLNAGHDIVSENLSAFKIISNNINVDNAKYRWNGGPVFNNGNSRTSNGGMVLFYDTDTIVASQAIEKRSSGSSENADEFKLGKAIKELFDLDINSSIHNYNFKI